MMMFFFNILQFATWDTAFQMLPFARIDPSFTKDQLLLFLGNDYMKEDGQVGYLSKFSKYDMHRRCLLIDIGVLSHGHLIQ